MDTTIPSEALKRTSALDTARMAALRTRILRRCSLHLNDQEYRMLRDEGFRRTDVDRVINALAAAGEITTDATCGAVVVRIAEQAGRQGCK